MKCCVFVILGFVVCCGVAQQPECTYIPSSPDSFCLFINNYPSSCSTIFINESIIIETECTLDRPSISITCARSDVNIHADAPLRRPGFRVERTQFLRMMDCNVTGAAIEFNVTGNLTLQRCFLDGLNKAIPINVFNALNVVLENVTVVRGYAPSASYGGGCVSLRAVKSSVTLNKVLIQYCTAVRLGGCLLITGDNTIAEAGAKTIDDLYVPDELTGGNISITNSVFEYCKSMSSSAGVAITGMSHIYFENNTVQHGNASNYNGCILMNTKFSIVVRRSIVLNCTAVSVSGGCGQLSGTMVEISDSSFSKCSSNSTGGCIRVDGANGLPSSIVSKQLIMKNVHLSSCRNTKWSCGGMELRFFTDTTITGLKIWDATSAEDGGGFCITYSQQVLITDAQLWSTSAERYGGAITIGGDTHVVFEGLQIKNSTVNNGTGPCMRVEANSSVVIRNARMQCFDNNTGRFIRYATNKTYVVNSGKLELDAMESSLMPLYPRTRTKTSSQTYSPPNQNNTIEVNITTLQKRKTFPSSYVTASTQLLLIATIGTLDGEASMTTYSLTALLTSSCTDTPLDAGKQSKTWISFSRVVSGGSNGLSEDTLDSLFGLVGIVIVYGTFGVGVVMFRYLKDASTSSFHEVIVKLSYPKLCNAYCVAMCLPLLSSGLQAPEQSFLSYFGFVIVILHFIALHGTSVFVCHVKYQPDKANNEIPGSYLRNLIVMRGRWTMGIGECIGGTFFSKQRGDAVPFLKGWEAHIAFWFVLCHGIVAVVMSSLPYPAAKDSTSKYSYSCEAIQLTLGIIAFGISLFYFLNRPTTMRIVSLFRGTKFLIFCIVCIMLVAMKTDDGGDVKGTAGIVLLSIHNVVTVLETVHNIADRVLSGFPHSTVNSDDSVMPDNEGKKEIHQHHTCPELEKNLMLDEESEMTNVRRSSKQDVFEL